MLNGKQRMSFPHADWREKMQIMIKVMCVKYDAKDDIIILRVHMAITPHSVKSIML